MDRTLLKLGVWIGVILGAPKLTAPLLVRIFEAALPIKLIWIIVCVAGAVWVVKDTKGNFAIALKVLVGMVCGGYIDGWLQLPQWMGYLLRDWYRSGFRAA